MNILTNIYTFYADGFRRMTVGRQLWILIIVKVIIFFAILKVFFFPDILATKSADGDKASAARTEILSRSN